MNDYWEILIKNYGTIHIKTDLIKGLCSYIQSKPEHLESGGILIGKHLKADVKIVIESYTPPQPTDEQKRCSYYRSEKHSELAKKIWLESKGHSTFVGLWHTHPEPNPEPSSIDLKDWSNALNNSSYEGSHLFFVIVGQKSMRCWSGQKGLRKNNIEYIGEFKYGNKYVE